MIRKTNILIYYKLSVLILIILIGFVVTQYIHLSKKSYEIIKEKDLFKAENNIVLQYYWQRIFVDSENISIIIKNDTIRNIFADNTYLTLFISDKHCSECVDFILTKLHNLANHNNSNIIIFLDYENPRFKKLISEKISSEFLVIDYRFTNNDRYSAPLLGIVSSNLTVSKLFFPSKEIPHLTDQYLSRIGKYIIKNSSIF